MTEPSKTYQRIYAVVARIPKGRVATYGQVAALAGLPHAPRVAGYALFAMPEFLPLPWHRVVAAGGRLSLGRLSHEAAATQRLKLEAEGVRFTAKGRVDLAHHAWTPHMRTSSPPKSSRQTKRPARAKSSARAKRSARGTASARAKRSARAPRTRR